jgi:hypothetical protein
VNKDTGQIHVEINGLAKPETPEATRICKEDLNEVVTSFLQDKTALERGLFDKENTLPEELTQLRMGKIVRERYPELSETDQEAIRQHAIAAMNITQQAKLALAQADARAGGRARQHGAARWRAQVHQCARPGHRPDRPHQSVRCRLCGAGEGDGREVAAPGAGQHCGQEGEHSEEEARELAKRALQFKNERGRLPDINSADAWEKRMAEGVAAFARTAPRPRRPGQGGAQWLTWTTTNCWMRWALKCARSRPSSRTARGTHHCGLRGHPALPRGHGARRSMAKGRDIFERLYAVRLDQLRKLPEARRWRRALQAAKDHVNLPVGGRGCRGDLQTRAHQSHKARKSVPQDIRAGAARFDHRGPFWQAGEAARVVPCAAASD